MIGQAALERDDDILLCTLDHQIQQLQAELRSVKRREELFRQALEKIAGQEVDTHSGLHGLPQIKQLSEPSDIASFLLSYVEHEECPILKEESYLISDDLEEAELPF